MPHGHLSDRTTSSALLAQLLCRQGLQPSPIGISRIARLALGSGRLQGISRCLPRRLPSAIRTTCMLNHLACVDQIASNLVCNGLDQFDSFFDETSVRFFGSGLTSIHLLLAPLAINRMYHVHFLNQGGRCWFRMNLGLVLNEAVEAEQEQRCPIFIIKSKRMKSTSMKHLIMKKSW